jgi:hypothetical protein
MMPVLERPANVDYANSPKDKLRGKHRPIMNDDLGAGFEAFLYAGKAEGGGDERRAEASQRDRRCGT